MLVEKNLSCGELFPCDRLSCGDVSPHEKCEENLSHIESPPHDKCGAKYVMWKNVEKSVMEKCFHMTRAMKNVENICYVEQLLHTSNEKYGEYQSRGEISSLAH